jgi:hypothetical protein
MPTRPASSICSWETHPTSTRHRRSDFWAEIEATWSSDAEPTRVEADEARVRGFYDDLRPHSSGEVYQNFPDPGLDDWLTAAYSENLES